MARTNTNGSKSTSTHEEERPLKVARTSSPSSSLDDDEPPLTYIARLVVAFRDCLKQLDAKEVTDVKLESMSVMIHECMSSSSRNYHSVQHVFDISANNIDSPIGVLAALFHDIIYYNVDGGLSAVQREMLRGVFRFEEDEVDMKKVAQSKFLNLYSKINKHRQLVGHDKWCEAHHDLTCEQDPLLCMVERIFGYDKGQEINTQNGINEFLSAVVAVRQLEAHLTREQLAQIAACIEATIPFKNIRDEETNTTSHMQTLYQNLVETRAFFKLDLSDDELIESVQLAARLANEDVGNFRTTDAHYFLDNTWSLLPEMNTSLRKTYLYTIIEYQRAVHSMNGFFGFLKPAVIFAQFQDTPSAAEMLTSIKHAELNMELGRKYVSAILMGASLLASFAALTGGDAPRCMFAGDLSSRNAQDENATNGNTNGKTSGYCENCAPLDATAVAIEAASSEVVIETSLETLLAAHTPNPPPDHCDATVFDILFQGRRSATAFDSKKAPLAAFLYARLGEEQIQSIIAKSTLHPIVKEENARKFVSHMPYETVELVGTIIARIAVSRAAAIRSLLEELKPKNE